MDIPSRSSYNDGRIKTQKDKKKKEKDITAAEQETKR
jgi:hypothetical protein